MSIGDVLRHMGLGVVDRDLRAGEVRCPLAPPGSSSTLTVSASGRTWSCATCEIFDADALDLAVRLGIAPNRTRALWLVGTAFGISSSTIETAVRAEQARVRTRELVTALAKRR